MSIFSFPDDNFSKCQWIFTKLGMYIDIVEIWFRNADGQISFIEFLTELSGSYTSMFSFPGLLNVNGFSPTWYVH